MLFLRSSGISGGENKITNGGWKKWRARRPQPVPDAAVNLKYADVNCRAFTFSACTRRMCVYFFLCCWTWSPAALRNACFSKWLSFAYRPVRDRETFKSLMSTHAATAAAQRCGAACLTGTTNLTNLALKAKIMHICRTKTKSQNNIFPENTF